MLNNPGVRGMVAGIIEPPARLLLKLHVSPDVVTVGGTIAVIAISLSCLPTGRFILGVVLLSLVAFSDLLDGTMARLSGRSGPWGNFLDATCDRLADGAVFAGLALYGANQQDPWTTGGALAALVAGQVVSYAKARAEAVGATANVGIAERAERLIVAALAILLTGLGVPWVLPIAMWIIAVLGLVTVVQRILHVRSQLMP
ncbi:MAG: phosphatidylinositol phosphate synthase [Actinomycetales bacterium]